MPNRRAAMVSLRGALRGLSCLSLPSAAKACPSEEGMRDVAKSVGPPNAVPHCCLPKAGETVVDENKRDMADGPCWMLPHHANLSQKLRVNHFQRLFVEESALKQEHDLKWNSFYGVDADNYVVNCLRLVRASAGSGDSQRRITLLGRIFRGRQSKGQHLAIAAFEQLKGPHPERRAVAAGGQPGARP